MGVMSEPALAPVPQGRPQRQPLVSAREVQPHPLDMAVVAGAEATLQQVQDALVPFDQWLALDGDPRTPLRNLIDHDATGPLRTGYGALRDLATGIQFLDGHGDLVTVGGVVVKNVAGYDLVKFLVGGHGCFGTPVTLTARTYRRPQAVLRLSLMEVPTPETVRQWLVADARPTWLLWCEDGVHLGWHGSDEELSSLVPMIAQAGEPRCTTLEEDVADRARMLVVADERLRISLPPATLQRIVGQIAPRRFAADPVHGMLWIPVPDRLNEALAAIRAVGGHAAWFGRDGVRLLGIDAASRSILAGLKKEFDPHARLAPLPIDS